MRESLQSIQKAPVLRDTFNSEQNTRLLGATPTIATYTNGTAYFSGAASTILYPIKKGTGFSVRIKLIAGTFTLTGTRFIFDNRVGTGTNTFYYSGGAIATTQGTVYVDGVATTTFTSSSKEIIVTGITLDSAFFRLMSDYAGTGNSIGTVELLEVYDYTLTANEVLNLYQNKRYEQLQYRNTLVTTTPLTVKGGVVRVIDSATGDIARTTSGWIEDEKYGWYAMQYATAWSAEFDTAVTRTGAKTLKLSTTDITGRVRVSHSTQSGSTNVVVSDLKHLIDCKPNTSYKFNCYVKTNNIATNSAFIYIAEYNNLVWVKDNESSRLSGTNDWTLLTKSFTTGATINKLKIVTFLNVAGNISDAWFDVNSMTLEEVSSITNSSSTPALYYPSATAVTSTDNIDQSQVSGAGGSGTMRLGDNGNNSKRGQSIVFSKKNLTGIIIQKYANIGSPTFNVTVSVQADSSGSPSGTNLGTPVTYTAAQWDAISNSTDFTVPYVLTVTPTATYWIVFTPSAQGDVSNYRTIVISGATNPYTSGGLKGYNGSVWSSLDTSYDMVFKTLYSKNTTNFTVSTATEAVSVTAPTPDGWANGTIIDTADGNYGITPLTLAPGVNTIYVSSNGASTADGTVDSSLQGTLGGTIVSNITEILNIDAKNGVIANKWNTTLTNTAVTPTRAGNIWAMNFNGTSSILNCGNYDSLVGDKTIVAWYFYNPYSTMPAPRLIDNGKLYIYSSYSDPRYWYMTSNGSTTVSSGIMTSPVGRWKQIVVTRTSTGVANFYIDGVLSGTANQASGTPVAGTLNISIGAYVPSYTDQAFRGQMSAVRIINGILTAQEVSQLFSNERRNYGI